MQALGVEPPFAIGVSLGGVANARVRGQDGWFDGSPIRATDLHLPMQVLEEFDTVALRQIVKSLFDIVFQAAGYSQASEFDKRLREI
jgi:hypothetical protein